MIMHRFLIAAAALALSACAAADAQSTAANTPEGGRDCFRAADVTGYSTVDDHHVRVRVGASRRYILGTAWNVNDLNWSNRIAIRSSNDWICTGNGLGVDIVGGDPRRRRPINSVERAPEEAPQGS